MTDQTERPYAAFRLNLQQQKKRAKERAKAAGVQLAKAQFDIATELGFASWAKLKLHIAAMDRERAAMDRTNAATSEVPPPLDADLRTLHLRCGSDIHKPLIEAGFKGDFLEHSYPYAQGPVREGPGALEQRARFIVDGFGNFMQLDYESQLAGAYNAERQLLDSALA